MSARKWKEEQRQKQQILLADPVYIANAQAADRAMREGRISKYRYLTVLNWGQRAALRRHEHRQEGV